MSPKVLHLVIIFLWMGVFILISQADTANHAYQLKSVSQILSGQVGEKSDQSYVVLIGRVIRPVGDDDYIFSDGTGMIRLHSEDSRLMPGHPIMVGGRIDESSGGQVTVKVLRWRIFTGSTVGFLAR